ncbi:hypothetical protein, partial [Bacteroides uniformis]
FPIINLRSTCSCTTCIVYVNLFKDRSFHDCCSFQKADAKVRTLRHIFQIFSEVFFIFSFFSFLVVSLVEREAKRKRKKKTGHRFLKEECQLALLSFSKAGAKVRTLKHNFQMFRKFFFHFSFPRPKFRKKPMAKKRKMEAYRSVLLSECQNIAAFVPESGCKSSAFTDICKIYTSFF